MQDTPDGQPPAADRIVHFRWMYQAMPDDELRAVAARRIDLSPEESAALGEVLAQRQLVLNPPPEYRGFTGFLRRHFRGDYPLARSYWLHTFALTSVTSMVLLALLPLVAALGKARHTSLAVLLAMLLMAALWVWANVGTWASATKHANRGGSTFWAGAAQIAIVLGLLGNVRELIVVSPALLEHARTALGEQPGEAVEFVLRADGRSLLLRGGINDDTAEGLEQALKRAPGVKTVVLESAGGWIRQGQMIAAVIQRHGLATYVETECTSACTIAFLAGRDRAADPDSRLGFHAFRGVGGARILEDERQVYGEAGLGAEFIRRIRNTPSQTVWYPSHAILLRERVLTRASTGGETAALATTMKRREDLANAFRKVATYAALDAHQPAHFTRAVDAAWSAVQARRIDREVLGAARAELTAASRQLLPTADDDTIESYVALLADEAAHLSDTAPEACAELVLHATGKPYDYGSLLPKPLLGRERELLQAVFETSSPAHRRPLSNSEVDAMLRRVFAVMKPQDVQVITTLRSRAHRPQASCAAGLALLDAVLALPPRERSLHARALFAS